MCNDGMKKDYYDARCLYANPGNWLANMKKEEREIDKLGLKYTMHAMDTSISVASEQMSEGAKIALLD